MSARQVETSVARSAEGRPRSGQEERAPVELARRIAELERSNAELEAFAHIASHELQEPVRKIAAFAELLRAQGTLSGRSAELVERMSGAAARMARIVNGLLEYSRRGQDPVPAKLDLSALLGALLRELGPRLEGASVALAAPLPSAWADERLTRSILRQLVENALKFRRPDAPARVTVRGEVRGGSVEVSVEDEGIGFEQGDAERIFKPFNRLHHWSEYEGSGIGLAQARRLARRQDGELRAEAVPGRGARFILSLPSGEGR